MQAHPDNDRRIIMTAPLVHIFTAGIRDGQLEGFKEYAREHASFTEAKAPDLLAFHQYLSGDGRRAFVVQIHPDADHMDYFMKEVVAEHGIRAYEYLEHGSERSDAFGPLHDATAERIRQHGVELQHHPYHLGGFTRLQSGHLLT
jgi:hypothetical protein